MIGKLAHRSAHEAEGFLGTTRELREIKRGRRAMRRCVRQRKAPVARNEHELAAMPAPTQPVVVPVSSTLVMPDTLPAATASTTPTLDAPTVASGTWCVQVAAPEDMAKAESRRDAAQSLLLLPFVIETEKGLHKVRTRESWTREAADAIRQRAIGSGFDGVFLVDRAAAPAKPAPAKVTPARKHTSPKHSTHRRARGRTR